jgi:hypothetical protein
MVLPSLSIVNSLSSKHFVTDVTGNYLDRTLSSAGIIWSRRLA